MASMHCSRRAGTSREERVSGSVGLIESIMMLKRGFRNRCTETCSGRSMRRFKPMAYRWQVHVTEDFVLDHEIAGTDRRAGTRVHEGWFELSRGRAWAAALR